MTRRLALVTGGASPIGAAICRRLAEDGHELLIHAHAGLQRAEALAAEIAAGGCIARAFACDVTDIPATAATLEALVAGGPPVQVLVHNAGTHDDVPLAGMSEAQWRGVVDVSLTGFYAVLRPLILPMIGTRWGRVIAISLSPGLPVSLFARHSSRQLS